MEKNLLISFVLGFVVYIIAFFVLASLGLAVGWSIGIAAVSCWGAQYWYYIKYLT
jgi:hypothetical protein